MAPVALPASKILSLVLKTLSKPLSKHVKHQFAKNEYTQGFLVGIGQGTHQVTSRLTMWSSGYKVRSIHPLEEKDAMKNGAEFVGEAFVLSVATGVAIWEYNRSSESNRRKEEQKLAKAKAERDALNAQLVKLTKRLEALEEVVKSNRGKNGNW
eukprot:CAMPEP_0178907832 /NCGR_PEP_ID=MMETSP0786-20121207/7589_1 /TAXON_ID=186022 /ORGANISM="Thalassionema frauenfeldii, Strain CCMP 1798" /LENGTH=153 /DNA_ID=CAMNT_0020579673 /DNA_START=55 /DNA_END=513 /DNA_ORIENTATION=+